jgi:hypothetical protein
MCIPCGIASFIILLKCFIARTKGIIHDVGIEMFLELKDDGSCGVQSGGRGVFIVARYKLLRVTL